MNNNFYEVVFSYSNTIYHVSGINPQAAAEKAFILYIKDGGKLDSCLSVAVTKE